MKHKIIALLMSFSAVYAVEDKQIDLKELKAVAQNIGRISFQYNVLTEQIITPQNQVVTYNILLNSIQNILDATKKITIEFDKKEEVLLSLNPFAISQSMIISGISLKIQKKSGSSGQGMFSNFSTSSTLALGNFKIVPGKTCVEIKDWIIGEKDSRKEVIQEFIDNKDSDDDEYDYSFKFNDIKNSLYGGPVKLLVAHFRQDPKILPNISEFKLGNDVQNKERYEVLGFKANNFGEYVLPR